MCPFVIRTPETFTDGASRITDGTVLHRLARMTLCDQRERARSRWSSSKRHVRDSWNAAWMWIVRLCAASRIRD